MTIKLSLGAILIAAVTLVLGMPALAGMDIIPCAVGSKWEYESSKLLRATITHQRRTMADFKDASAGTCVYEVVSVDAKASPAVFNYTESTSMNSARGGDADTEKVELRLVNDAGGLKILSSYRESAQQDKPDKQSYDPPLLYYTAKAALAGKTWKVGEMRDADTRTFMVGKGAGRETVTVPAGTFKDCLKVVYSSDDVSGTMDMWDKTFTLTSGKSRGVYWIADGVGVVKELEVATTTAEAAGPDGKPMVVEAVSCTVTELKPGYVVKK